MFSQACMIPSVHGGGAWVARGACMVKGGMHGEGWGACMVKGGGLAW